MGPELSNDKVARLMAGRKAAWPNRCLIWRLDTGRSPVLHDSNATTSLDLFQRMKSGRSSEEPPTPTPKGGTMGRVFLGAVCQMEWTLSPLDTLPKMHARRYPWRCPPRRSPSTRGEEKDHYRQCPHHLTFSIYYYLFSIILKSFLFFSNFTFIFIFYFLIYFLFFYPPPAAFSEM